MRRLLSLAAAALLLGGCNLVYSETPLFGKADARGAPALKPGVWAKRHPGCEFDPARPVKEWPECAEPGLITRDRLGDAAKPEERARYILAAGDPRVLQFEFKPPEATRVLFLFMGAEVLKTDEKGRIVEVRLWLAQCGPPPPPAPEGEKREAEPVPENETEAEMQARIQRETDAMFSQGVTREPLPGLELREGMCLAREQGPVRNAVAASKAWDTEPAILYWVRERP